MGAYDAGLESESSDGGSWFSSTATGTFLEASLVLLAECHQPLLWEIVGYTSDSAATLTSFCDLASGLLSRTTLLARNDFWGQAFCVRWPAFHAALDFQGPQDWREAYRQTLGGKREYILEIFDREKKLGFAMAAMPAMVTFDRRAGGFVARYLSALASELSPEEIPAVEGHRLRFCPPSARAQLQPGVRVDGACAEARSLCYPYRVLEGFEGLAVGQGVELQWKMQLGSPFGWWYGHLEHLQLDADGKLANATITFRHFPSRSRWYRLEVRFGDAEMRRCSFGGFTGGVRPVTPSEHRHWMRFFPGELVLV